MPTSLVGRVFGRFHVIERLGAGGMGEVYRAHDDHLQRDVALKVLAGSSAAEAEDEGRRRMRREAHVLSTLNHPNIATIHDLVEIENVSFVVMELITGESLADRLKRGPLTPSAVLELAGQIAAGLGEAHRHGIVHRDLKPANLMCTADGQLKIVDFGIAATIVGHDGATATDLDRGLVTGTLPYMSPEQIAGTVADARADIWAFGVVLYELVTGRRPFEAANALLLGDVIKRPVDAVENSRASFPPRPQAIT
jgi:serine/threonine protein kinase